MRFAIWRWVAVAALLLLCLPGVSVAETVLADGVLYALSDTDALIVGFAPGVSAATIPPKFRGLPTSVSEAYAGDGVEALIFAEGVVSLEPYYPLLASAALRRVEFSDTVDLIEEEAYLLRTWLSQARWLESAKAPAGISEEAVDHLVWNARELNQYAPHTWDSFYFDRPDTDLRAYRMFSRLEIDPEHPTRYDIDGIVYEKGTNALLTCLPGRAGVCDVPQGTTRIAERAFSSCDQLERITLPYGLTDIDRGAFSLCAGLRSVQLPPTLERIGERAFYNCVSLTSLIIPDGAMVARDAFEFCTALRAVYFFGDATVDAYAFRTNHPDLVVYAPADSDASRAAAVCGVLWAEPGGKPQRLPSPYVIPTAIVHGVSDGERLPLYAEPDASSEILDRFAVGASAEVLARQGEWARVRFYEGEGYMPLGQLMFPDPLDDIDRILSIEVFFEGAVLYEGPSQSAPAVVPKYREGFDVLQRYGTWYLVEGGGRRLFIPIRDAQPEAMCLVDEEVYIVSAADGRWRANLYHEPSEGSECLASFYDGTQVAALTEWIEGDDGVRYAHVAVGGQEGYIKRDDLCGVWEVWFLYAW